VYRKAHSWFRGANHHKPHGCSRHISRGRVLLNAECRLLANTLGLGDGSQGWRVGAVERCVDTDERGSVTGWLAAKVCVGLRSALMVDTGALGGLGCLGLCRGRHEGDERIADGLLHRVRAAAIERHAVDDRLDDDASAHELAYRVNHVGVVATKPIDPTHD